MRVSAAAAGAVIAGGALLGAAQVSGLNPAGALQPAQQRDVALASSPFDQALANLLTALGIGDKTLPDLVGPNLTIDQFLTLSTGLTTTSDLSQLLAFLNPDHLTVGDIGGPTLSDTVDQLLSALYVGGSPVAGQTIDTALSSLLGGGGTGETVDSLFNALGIGPSGSLDLTGFVTALCEFGAPICTPALDIGTLSGTSTVSQLLSSLLQTNAATETVQGYIDSPAVNLGTEHVYQLLGLTTTDLNEAWNVFVSDLPSGGLFGSSTVGQETLAELLTSLLPGGSPAVGDGAGEISTVSEFLTTWDPSLATETINALLGLT